METWEYQGGTFTAVGSWVQGGAQKVSKLENDITKKKKEITDLEGRVSDNIDQLEGTLFSTAVSEDTLNNPDITLQTSNVIFNKATLAFQDVYIRKIKFNAPKIGLFKLIALNLNGWNTRELIEIKADTVGINEVSINNIKLYHGEYLSMIGIMAKTGKPNKSINCDTNKPYATDNPNSSFVWEVALQAEYVVDSSDNISSISAQLKKNNEDLSNISDNLPKDNTYYNLNLSSVDFEQGSLDNNLGTNSLLQYNNSIRSRLIRIIGESIEYFRLSAGLTTNIIWYDEFQNYISFERIDTSYATSSTKGYFMRFSIQKPGATSLNPSDVDASTFAVWDKKNKYKNVTYELDVLNDFKNKAEKYTPCIILNFDNLESEKNVGNGYKYFQFRKQLFEEYGFKPSAVIDPRVIAEHGWVDADYRNQYESMISDGWDFGYYPLYDSTHITSQIQSDEFIRLRMNELASCGIFRLTGFHCSANKLNIYLRNSLKKNGFKFARASTFDNGDGRYVSYGDDSFYYNEDDTIWVPTKSWDVTQDLNYWKQSINSAIEKGKDMSVMFHLIYKDGVGNVVNTDAYETPTRNLLSFFKKLQDEGAVRIVNWRTFYQIKYPARGYENDYARIMLQHFHDNKI